MQRALISGILAGGLMLVGCSAVPQAPSAPLAPEGTLAAEVTIGAYRIQERTGDIATLSCRVRQAGPEIRQELGKSQLELGKFVFKLAEGTASVVTEAVSAAGAPIGRAEAIVGIRAGQVTLLRQVLEIGGQNDSFLRPLTPLPIP